MTPADILGLNVGLLGVTAITLGVIVLALYDDSWARRVAAFLIARSIARQTYREVFAAERKRLLAALEVPGDAK